MCGKQAQFIVERQQLAYQSSESDYFAVSSRNSLKNRQMSMKGPCVKKSHFDGAVFNLTHLPLFSHTLETTMEHSV